LRGKKRRDFKEGKNCCSPRGKSTEPPGRVSMTNQSEVKKNKNHESVFKPEGERIELLSKKGKGWLNRSHCMGNASGSQRKTVSKKK